MVGKPIVISYKNSFILTEQTSDIHGNYKKNKKKKKYRENLNPRIATERGYFCQYYSRKQLKDGNLLRNTTEKR